MSSFASYVCHSQAALFWTTPIACFATLQKGISPTANHNDQSIFGSDPSAFKYTREGSSDVHVRLRDSVLLGPSCHGSAWGQREILRWLAKGISFKGLAIMAEVSMTKARFCEGYCSYFLFLHGFCRPGNREEFKLIWQRSQCPSEADLSPFLNGEIL